MNEEIASLFAKAPVEDGRIDRAALAYLSARVAKEAAEAALAERSKEAAAAEESLLSQMEEAKVTAIKIYDGKQEVLVSASTSVHYSAQAGLLEETGFVAWLLRAGGHDLIKRTIHHASFSAFCRELAEAGKSVHQAVKVVTRKCVRVKKG